MKTIFMVGIGIYALALIVGRFFNPELTEVEYVIEYAWWYVGLIIAVVILVTWGREES